MEYTNWERLPVGYEPEFVAQEEGVTIPTPVFVGALCFFAGVLLGPAFHVVTRVGAERIRKMAEERLAKS